MNAIALPVRRPMLDRLFAHGRTLACTAALGLGAGGCATEAELAADAPVGEARAEIAISSSVVSIAFSLLGHATSAISFFGSGPPEVTLSENALNEMAGRLGSQLQEEYVLNATAELKTVLDQQAHYARYGCIERDTCSDELESIMIDKARKMQRRANALYAGIQNRAIDDVRDDQDRPYDLSDQADIDTLTARIDRGNLAAHMELNRAFYVAASVRLFAAHERGLVLRTSPDLQVDEWPDEARMAEDILYDLEVLEKVLYPAYALAQFSDAFREFEDRQCDPHPTLPNREVCENYRLACFTGPDGEHCERSAIEGSRRAGSGPAAERARAQATSARADQAERFEDESWDDVIGDEIRSLEAELRDIADG